MKASCDSRGVLVALACAFLLAGPALADDGYSSEGANACLDCHENSGVLGILETKHADTNDPNSPAAQKQCQSCHGPSARHMKFPMQVANLRFGKASKVAPREQNQQCLECHAEGGQADWSASAHGFEDVLCNGCHAIHQPDRIVPSRAKVAAKCTDGCHSDLMKDAVSGKEATADTFTHPVGMELEGGDLLTCSTCHDPHGPLDSTRCVECHAQTPEVLAKQSERARRFHATAEEKGTECIRCHKGLAHPIGPLEQAARPVHPPFAVGQR